MSMIAAAPISRRALLRGVGALGAAVAGLSADVAPGGVAHAVPGGGPDLQPRAGWCVYDWSIVSAQHLAAVAAAKPTLIRWFVSWDRFHKRRSYTEAIPPSPPRELWTGAAWTSLWQRLAPSSDHPQGTKLVVQLQVKEQPTWRGDAAPWWTQGTSWARSTKWMGREWPDAPGVTIDNSYGAFARDLRDVLTAAGVAFVFGAWNEVDLRTGWPTNGQENFHNPWYVGANPANGVPYFGWSGGSGALYEQLYASLPGHGWTTSGITKPGWMDKTVTKSLGEIDIHRYYGTAASVKYLPDISAMVAQWDAAAGRAGKPRLPFFVGEHGPDSSSTKLVGDLRQCARAQQRHAILAAASANPASPLFGRYLGATAHWQKPWPWEVPVSDPRMRWWIAHPLFAQYYD